MLQLSQKMKILYFLLRVFNEKILRKTKESTALLIQVLSIGNTNTKKFLKYFLKSPLKLYEPSQVLPFPQPNRWSNNISYKLSLQRLYMVVMQLGLNSQTGVAQQQQIDKQADRSESALYTMKFLQTDSKPEIEQVERIIKKFNYTNSLHYDVDREVIFSESIVNGQHVYMLSRYGNQNHFDFSSSKQLSQEYRLSFQNALKQQTLNQENLKKVGLTRELIQEKLKNREAYSMLFQDLQMITDGRPLENKPTIFMDNVVIQDTHYLQAPFPIYVKINHEDQQVFICIAIGFRYKGLANKQIKFFSPFFAEQPQKIWRLAQAQLGQAITNDFGVRFHLGTLHFTTNQYNVPMYNYIKTVIDQKKDNYSNFLRFSYTHFNLGLDGVNATATASFLHAEPTSSILNNIFNLSQENTLRIMAEYSNRVDLTKFDPISFAEAGQLNDKGLERVALDQRLYTIIKNYVHKVYEIYEIEKQSEQLLLEINKEIRKMTVDVNNKKRRYTHRPQLKCKEDVLKLITNLVFCWAGFHNHTFSTITLASYYNIRPTMLRKSVPHDKKDWDSYQVGSQVPNSKVLMATGKLNQASSQQDEHNFLLNGFNVLLFQVQRELKYKITNDPSQNVEMEKILIQTITDLQAFGEEVERVNKRRSNLIQFTWLHPDHMQSSLNI